MPIFFAFTLFLSAVLLFLIQPMIAKAVLPLLGGTPAVWNTCMVFFQAALLAGYAYAHATTGWLGVRRQTLLHAVVLLLPFLVLPIAVREQWISEGDANPVWAVLMLLAVSVGLPFFVVSTSAPLVQKWFASTGHPSAADPYFLYGASNLGSMLALLGYPVLTEPMLRLADQFWWWAVGYGVFVVFMLACALVVWRSSPSEGENVSASDALPPQPSDAPTLLRRLHWIALAFAPSSLMLGVTTLITFDIAAIPLLWVIPLAIYLLSFILVFSRLPEWVHKIMVGAMPVIVLTVVFAKVFIYSIGITILLHLLVLFVVAMVCHGELARTRPPATHLTEFYLWMSLGGVLGGLFNALAAPLIFNDIIEYYVVLAIAGMLLPARAKADVAKIQESQHGYPAKAAETSSERRWAEELLAANTKLARSEAQLASEKRKLDLALPFGLVGLALVMIYKFPDWVSYVGPRLTGKILDIVVYAPLFVICYVFADRPIRFGLGLAGLTAVILIIQEQPGIHTRVLHRDRSFFGVIQVAETRIDKDGTHYHRLDHGTTLHGTQNRQPDRRREATTYYHKAGPIGQLFEALKDLPPRKRFAVIGLGTGSLLCYAQPGEEWTYYEIDPLIVQIATNSDYFSFWDDCPAAKEIVLGDARLRLKEAPDGRYGLIVVDAFSSDAIPIHLLTREAVELYFQKLRPDGLLALHISNRYLELEPVTGRLAQELKLAAVVRSDQPNDEVQKSGSHWVVFARQPQHLGKLLDDDAWPEDENWKVLKAPENAPLWTDDFSNLLGIFDWKSAFRLTER